MTESASLGATLASLVPTWTDTSANRSYGSVWTCDIPCAKFKDLDVYFRSLGT